MNQYYLAPLEGITTAIYRNAYHKYFHPMDKYFTPFLVPHSKKGFSAKEKREIDPENNKGFYLVPQIMSNHADDCVKTIDKLKLYGYQEINLNMGCPSKTVVSKGRGSGFLAFPEDLDRFLDEVFEQTANTDVKISIKTRIGKTSAEEFPRLLDIYNKYPLEELIIHPRLQSDYYKNVPNLEKFAYAVKNCRHRICYNGDIFDEESCERIENRFPEIETVMLGRGILKNPLLVDKILGEKKNRVSDKERIKSFLNQIYDDYQALGIGDKNVLFKMKELWCYLGDSFANDAKSLKKIRKANRKEQYEEAVREILGP